jgi:hypothetical protein
MPPDPAAAAGRWSLRTRNAQQLKPYTIENALYQRQLKNNRDAIVRLPRIRSTPEPSQDLSQGDREFIADESQEQEESQELGQSMEEDTTQSGTEGPDRRWSFEEEAEEAYDSDPDLRRIRSLARKAAKANKQAEAKKNRMLPRKHKFPGIPDTDDTGSHRDKGKAPERPFPDFRSRTVSLVQVVACL